MLFKIIMIFLLAMVLVGMIGKALFPDALSRRLRKGKDRAPVCRRCGRYVVGKRCDCDKKG
ncbi:hypothetical protein [Pseudotabrizicola sp. L79]|uniref:hypothetical protein n=1 Tax=Pseudotabrizicola sp. L79 TaxID=3118402 RepID=UPI002F94D53A